MTKICVTCGQPLPQAKRRRICADCGKPMRLHDKWHIGGDGRLHHNDCDDPDRSKWKGIPPQTELIPQ